MLLTLIVVAAVLLSHSSASSLSTTGADASSTAALTSASPRLVFPFLMFSASYVLLDAFLGLVITRLFYLGAKKTIEYIFDLFEARLQARLSSRSALPCSTFLSLSPTVWPSGRAIVPASEWNGGGVGGTNVPDHRARVAPLRIFLPFTERLRGHDNAIAIALGQHPARTAATATSELVRSAQSAALAVANRRDWIAVTDPTRSIEVPVYPEIISLVKALALEIRESRGGRHIVKMFNSLAAFVGAKTEADKHTKVSPASPTNLHGSPVIRQLPQELVAQILILAACPSLSPNEPRSSPTSILLLSKLHYALIAPRLYHSVSLHTPSTFRMFRCTLALHNPALGKYVRRLQIGSSEFDGAGYCPAPLADHGPLAVGIEQMLLASPHLQELSLDLFSMSALHTGTVSRLEKGPQPKRLCAELTTIPYLSLPTFEDLEQLELLVFGMDALTAQELRVTLPLLSRLTLRLVTRRRGLAFQNGRDTWLPTELGVPHQVDEHDQRETDSDEERERETGERQDIFQLESDMEEFMQAVEVLRKWPDGDARMGKKLDQITICAWPSAVKKLRRRFCNTQDGGALLKIELDRGYLLGPRRGAHVLWRKDSARAAWAI